MASIRETAGERRWINAQNPSYLAGGEKGKGTIQLAKLVHSCLAAAATHMVIDPFHRDPSYWQTFSTYLITYKQYLSPGKHGEIRKSVIRRIEEPAAYAPPCTFQPRELN